MKSVLKQNAAAWIEEPASTTADSAEVQLSISPRILLVEIQLSLYLL